MCVSSCVFFFKQKTAYEMRISDWSSDVCSSDLPACRSIHQKAATLAGLRGRRLLISIVDKEAVSEARAQTKKGPAFAGPLLSLGCHLLQQRHQQQQIGRAS